MVKALLQGLLKQSQCNIYVPPYVLLGSPGALVESFQILILMSADLCKCGVAGFEFSYRISLASNYA